ncbi:hypothetical protein SLG_10430 [Sphingobium sp. SYK-6]|uniref:DUF4142 domain-containing protein n=1 Tax=Sphingobium sp. (strain NBRC 103272 / SYK-6) TaxID=627192 RepID=UPI0002276673|nr:DUF4142 domain-containing protein [Sphingobium sp. SYK-6]BAK65718.1 hypothetical protein SLG_10430 [Sphingobium sp. SYK-6]
MIAMRTALLALPLLAVAACNSNVEQDVEGTVDRAENAATNTIDNVTQSLTPTPSGQEFANTAARSDAFEIAAAKLAATNAQSAEVKEFAQKMIEAHTQSTARIKEAAGASQPQITPDATLSRDQQEDLNELKALKGAKFDEEYIDGQVDAHEDALALMRKYATDGTVTPLKAAAGELAPVIEQHLAHARRLDRN